MIVTCDRILLPDFEDEALKSIEDQRMQRVRCTFDMEDVAAFSEYRRKSKKYIHVIFYYTDPWIIDMTYEEFQKKYEEVREQEEGGLLQFSIPAN